MRLQSPKRTRRTTLAGALAASLFLPGLQAWAQEAPSGKGDPAGTEAVTPTLKNVVVTAQKRPENAQDVPIAITTFDADMLDKLNVNNVRDLGGMSPSLQVAGGDANANPKLFIRGVGSNDFTPMGVRAVGVYIDGIYVASAMAQMGQFFDIDQIEVLNGPQGTLFGRNTTGGAINVTTKRPTREFSSEIEAKYGSFNGRSLDGAVGGAIGNSDLSYRIAGKVQRDDGYIENRVTGNDVGITDNWALRAQLLFEPSEDFNLLWQVYGGQNHGSSTQAQQRALFPTDQATADIVGSTGLCTSDYGSGKCTDYLGYADTDKNSRAADYNSEGRDKVDQVGTSLIANRNFGNVTFVSLSSLDRVRRNDYEDTDASPNNMLEILYRAQEANVGQEFRLQSSNNEVLSWVSGLTYGHSRLTGNDTTDILGIYQQYYPEGYSVSDGIGWFGSPYVQTTDSYGIYGQADYKFRPRWTATMGLRYSYDRKQYDGLYTASDSAYTLGERVYTYQGDKGWGAPSGRLGLSYALSDRQSLYGSYNRGYKAGGFFPVSGEMRDYQNETVNAYELGYKAELWDRRLRFNAAAFYYAYRDMQVYTITLQNGVNVSVLDNAASAKMYGLEMQATARLSEDWTVNLGTSFLHAKFGDYNSDLATEDYSGNTLSNAPKFSSNLMIDYAHPLAGGWTILGNASATYRTHIWLDTSNTSRISSDKLFLLGGRLALRMPNQQVEFGVWGQNLTNRVYVTDISNLESLGFDALSMGRPRTFGVYASYKY